MKSTSSEKSDTTSTSDEEFNNGELQEWQPNFERGKHFSSLIISSRNSGKSYLTRYLLLYKLRDKYDLFVIFCSNIEEREKYEEIVPTNLSFQNFKPDLVAELMEKNEQRVTQGKKRLNILMIFDDSVGNQIKNDDSLLQTFSNGRHKGISCIFISQSYSLCSPVWRTNSDIIILLKQNSSRARENVRDNFLMGSLYTPDNINEKKFYNSIIRKYMSKVGDSIIIDYTGSSSDNVYRYRAPDDLE